MPGSKTNRYRNGNARRKLRDRLRRTETVCPICGHLLDWELRTPDGWSVELDEKEELRFIPPRYRAKAVIDPDNVQAVHRRCNIWKRDHGNARPPWAVGGQPASIPKPFVRPSGGW